MRRSLAGALLAAPDARPQAHALTGGDQPGGGLRADPEHAIRSRRGNAGRRLRPAPREACQVLDATTTWWRILINPDDTSLDDDFQQRVAAAIAATERWTEREPRSAEAWFYLGAAYGARVSWRVQRKEHLAAARDGKRIKEALERALALDPGLSDARFGIGLYKYYAAIAPAFARFFRFLFLLPGGNREEGLSDMEAVHARGVLLRGEADYQLHWIYLWYENQPQRALELLRALCRAVPGQPALRRADRRHRGPLPARPRREPEDLAGDDRPRAARWAIRGWRPRWAGWERRACWTCSYETDRAVDELRRVVDSSPAAPFGVDGRGRSSGLARCWIAWAIVPPPWSPTTRRSTRCRPRIPTVSPPRPEPASAARRSDLAAAQAYRLSLTGWRAFERGALEQAARALAGAATAAPGDTMIRVRLARVRAARNEIEPALAEFDRIIAMRSQARPAALGAAYFWSAELLEQQGRKDVALARYRAVSRIFGTDSRLTAAAAKAIARLSR